MVDELNELVWESVEFVLVDGEFKLVVDMLFPGKPIVDGTRLSGGRGRSAGGRGAGPGFMNCPGA